MFVQRKCWKMVHLIWCIFPWIFSQSELLTPASSLKRLVEVMIINSRVVTSIDQLPTFFPLILYQWEDVADLHSFSPSADGWANLCAWFKLWDYPQDKTLMSRLMPVFRHRRFLENNPQSCHVSFLHTGAEIRRAYSSLESETSDESSIHGWFRVLFWRLGGFPCRTVTSTSWSMWQPWAWWCEGRWSTSCGGISNCTMWMEMAALTDTSSSTS